MTPRTLMIFVDGFGIGSADPQVNPFAGAHASVLENWISRHAIPLDVTMGVPGLPQSATGQTALLTGINAAAELGHHAPGFPGERLRTLIREHNIFDRLHARGYKTAFANAYYLESIPERVLRRPPSVTTVAVQQAHGQFRDGAVMRAGQAVFHDLTREGLRERGYEGPLLTPEEAALHLLALAQEHDFTLFEYFETDKVGHRGSLEQARMVVRKLDRLAGELERGLDPERDLLILTSDHGNMEDMTSGQHTLNPVPFIAIGPGSERLLREVRSITDVTPALLQLYPKRATGATGGGPPAPG
jgi:2,3-bisphosphoglycerate-independent phosphoglycerate mutase